LAEGGDRLTILPRAVRKYEVEQAAFFAAISSTVDATSMQDAVARLLGKLTMDSCRSLQLGRMSQLRTK
tara:strand:+ start:89 stop:295 length:207 start_codon:yes stop_codon:yes gene_type:complete